MTNYVMDRALTVTKSGCVLSTQDILQRLSQRNVKRARIAEAIGLPAPRITEMYKGDRRLYHDEAVKLVEAFGLDDRPALSEPVARLLVLHTLNQLALPVDPESEQVQELALDFRAFSEFAASPGARENLAALDAFLRGRASANQADTRAA